MSFWEDPGALPTSETTLPLLTPGLGRARGWGPGGVAPQVMPELALLLGGVFGGTPLWPGSLPQRPFFHSSLITSSSASQTSSSTWA